MVRRTFSLIFLCILALPSCGGFHKEYMKKYMDRFALGLSRRESISNVLRNPTFPEKWPYKPIDFARDDDSTDSSFYQQPRFVYHIDEPAVAALTGYYRRVLTPNSTILDICSSWVSHFPEELKTQRVVGIGMNRMELQKNPQLTEFVVQDLNNLPTFPFANDSFDYVTCVVSVDYLIHPLEVFQEIHRVLKPNGLAIISQSNRCFPTKAINIWLNTNDYEHIFIIGSYFHYAGGFKDLQAIDLSPNPSYSDPLYIIQARKI